jgi:hypothetical protein
MIETTHTVIDFISNTDLLVSMVTPDRLKDQIERLYGEVVACIVERLPLSSATVTDIRNLRLDHANSCGHV